MERLIRIVCFWSVVAALIAGCDRLAEECLDVAEACMETNPDSAYSSLQCLALREDLTGEQRARYALLRTQAMHKCRIPLESDSLINVAVEYYTGSDDRHRLALSLLYKGLVHKQNHQVEQAVEAFVGSEQAFDGVEDNQYKALLYNHHGALLMNQGVYEEALTSYKESYRYKLLGDSLHYVVSACGQIANLYKMMNMPDSAQTYYERGLAYKDRLSGGKKRNYYLLLQSFAMFLIGNDNYPEAERLLQECLANMTDTHYLHTLYSALTTLYYEKREFDKALCFGRQVLTSDDSLTVCGGYLRLYKIYRAMEQMDSAFHYHNLYRQYDSDITLRRKTTEVAVIPHKLANQELKQENHAIHRWLWLWGIGLVVVVMVTIYIIRYMKRKHSNQMDVMGAQLDERKQELNEVSATLGKTHAELGRVMGAFSNQMNAIERMKAEHQNQLDRRDKVIERLRNCNKQKENDLREQKEKFRDGKHAEHELLQHVKKQERLLEKQTKQLAELERQQEIDRRIEHFMLCGYDSVAIDMLLQLRLPEEKRTRYSIKPSEYLPMLRNLLEQENPSLAEKLEKCELERKKLTMCYLMALGLDDVEMMARAACLAPNSVKAYRKECRELVQGLKFKV